MAIFWSGLSSWLADGCLLIVSTHWQGGVVGLRTGRDEVRVSLCSLVCLLLIKLLNIPSNRPHPHDLI